MHFTNFRFYPPVQQTSVSCVLSSRKTAPCRNSLFQISWRQHALLLDSHEGSSNLKISQCLDVILKAMQKIRKDLDVSNSDYEGTEAPKPHSDCSDKKRTP